MHEILSDLDRWIASGEDIALATLVRVHRAAPRPAGARLAVTRSGRVAGSISGGCVESDVIERAREVLDRRQPVVATYGIADEDGFRVGLSCGGTIDVLIEPFAPAAPWHAVRGAIEAGRPAALAVGLTPAALCGRALAVLGDGAIEGTIAADLDAVVAAAAREALDPGITRVVAIDRPEGGAEVFVESFPPPLRLVIVGATHTAMALGRMAKEVGFRVSVVDPRGVFATPERFPDVDEIVADWPAAALDRQPLDRYTYVVILTHDPKFDLPALERALRSEARYIGIIGSRTTQARRVAALREAGFDDGALSRLRAPIGLDLGATSPAEIGVAILAEMIAARYGRGGGPLSERSGAIHGHPDTVRNRSE